MFLTSHLETDISATTYDMCLALSKHPQWRIGSVPGRCLLINSSLVLSLNNFNQVLRLIILPFSKSFPIMIRNVYWRSFLIASARTRQFGSCHTLSFKIGRMQPVHLVSGFMASVWQPNQFPAIASNHDISSWLRENNNNVRDELFSCRDLTNRL